MLSILLVAGRNMRSGMACNSLNSLTSRAATRAVQLQKGSSIRNAIEAESPPFTGIGSPRGERTFSQLDPCMGGFVERKDRPPYPAANHPIHPLSILARADSTVTFPSRTDVVELVGTVAAEDSRAFIRQQLTPICPHVDRSVLGQARQGREIQPVLCLQKLGPAPLSVPFFGRSNV